MPIRITGLNSGLDTEAIISALVSSYSYKTNKYKKAQTKLSWKQDAWKTLNTKVYSFYTSLDSLRFSKNYNLKSTKVSDSTKATVTFQSPVTKFFACFPDRIEFCMGKCIFIGVSAIVTTCDNFIFINDHAANRNFIQCFCFFRLSDGFLHIFFVCCHIFLLPFCKCGILEASCNFNSRRFL